MHSLINAYLFYSYSIDISPTKTLIFMNIFMLIRAEGGGGTSFEVIFEYVRERMQDRLPVSIIILTDGYAPWPSEKKTMGIPVLWLPNNTQVEPPWGKVTRITT